MKKLFKNLTRLTTAAALTSSLGTSLVHAAPAAQVTRPPQFVLLAFDGSLNLAFWKESRDFAKELKNQGKLAPFTYFISGVYFLAKENREIYDAPHHGKGKSAIGFGGETKAIPLRVDQMNRAVAEGHEIASHANGHFDAGSEKWNLEDWQSEFSQFNKIIYNTFDLNRVRPSGQFDPALQFSEKDVVGFRAPQLGVTKSMRPALKEFRFTYDTSFVQAANYWPEKDSLGIWNVPLARISVVGTGKMAPAMDYNFYYVQSGAVDRPTQKEAFKKQMLDSYLKYFQENYNGSRAPVQIGHHFSKWNGGAYWEAMKEFTASVCGMPEVKCVTFKDYVAWLGTLSKEQLASYRAGQFAKPAEPIKLTENTQVRPVQVAVAQKGENILTARALTANIENLKGLRAQMSVNGKVMGSNQLDLNQIRKAMPAGSEAYVMAQIFARDGIEVARSTQKIRDLGLSTERLDKEALELRVQLGDMPEAHLSEKEEIPASLD